MNLKLNKSLLLCVAKCIQSINRCHNVTHAEIMQVTLQGRLIKLHFQLNYDNLIVNKAVVFLFYRISIHFGLLLRKLKTQIKISEAAQWVV